MANSTPPFNPASGFNKAVCKHSSGRHCSPVSTISTTIRIQATRTDTFPKNNARKALKDTPENKNILQEKPIPQGNIINNIDKHNHIIHTPPSSFSQPLDIRDIGETTTIPAPIRLLSTPRKERVNINTYKAYFTALDTIFNLTNDLSLSEKSRQAVKNIIPENDYKKLGDFIVNNPAENSGFTLLARIISLLNKAIEENPELAPKIKSAIRKAKKMERMKKDLHNRLAYDAHLIAPDLKIEDLQRTAKQISNMIANEAPFCNKPSLLRGLYKVHQRKGKSLSEAVKNFDHNNKYVTKLIIHEVIAQTRLDAALNDLS